MKKIIFVIDDEIEILELLKDRLLASDYQVFTFLDSEEAMKSLKTLTPHLIVLDMMMPKLDGIEFLKALHQNSLDIPVIMLSAKTQATCILDAKSLGAQDYLFKPFEATELLNSIQRILHNNTVHQQERKEIMTQNKKPKILIVDDAQDMLNLMESRLVSEGFEVIKCSDGVTGFELLVKDPPDLILLDIKMPKMDGYTFIKQMHRDEELLKIPVILVTGYDTMVDLFTVEGIVDYIIKPFDAEALIKKIRFRLAHLKDKFQTFLGP